MAEGRARPGRALLLGLLPLMLGLAGCETLNKVSATKDPRPCPRFTTVTGASSLTRFTGTGRDLTDVDFTAIIGNIRGECTYSAKAIDMTLQVPFIVERGPANRSLQAGFDYFVAVATLENQVPNGGRQSFSTVVPFHGTTMRNGGTEEVEQQIPIAANDSGANYIVYIGFVLSEDELKYNQQTPTPTLTAPPPAE